MWFLLENLDYNKGTHIIYVIYVAIITLKSNTFENYIF